MPSFGIGVAVTPSAFASTRKTVMPWDGFATSSSVRATRKSRSAAWASVDQIFVPLTTQPPSTFLARVCMAPSTSVPPPGSVSEIANISLPAAISGSRRLLLLVRPVRRDRLRVEERDAEQPVEARHRSRKLLVEDHLLEDPAALSAVLLGDADAGEAVLAELLPEIPRELLARLDLPAVVLRELVLDELAERARGRAAAPR